LFFHFQNYKFMSNNSEDRPLSSVEKTACEVAGSFVGTMVPYAAITGLAAVSPILAGAAVIGGVAWVINEVRKTNAEDGKK
jgi:hypothetical protein